MHVAGTRDAAGRSMSTRSTLAAAFRAAGIEGATVLVHTSLRSMGWVCGGAVTVVRALQDAVGPRGTLVMPAHSATNTDPALWRHPPVPEAWWSAIRAEMPPFDAETTPTERMGAVAEAFRSFPGVVRSAHPSASFTAWGREAEAVVRDHALGPPFGERSPLARLHDLDATVLLVGVGHEANTSLHLAEERWGRLPSLSQGSAVVIDGRRAWAAYRDLDYDADDFPRLGADFAAAGGVREHAVGDAKALAASQRALVEFATRWMHVHRGAGHGNPNAGPARDGSPHEL